MVLALSREMADGLWTVRAEETNSGPQEEKKEENGGWVRRRRERAKARRLCGPALCGEGSEDLNDGEEG